jgi:hypothetical protein
MQIQPDTPAPSNRVAASHFVPLGWWGVVNTTTLSEILAERSGKSEKYRAYSYWDVANRFYFELWESQ